MNAPTSELPKLERIMIADDEHLVGAGLADALKSLGYTVLGPATDGDAAVAMARAEAPQLAILDIRMPKKDGLEAAKSLWSAFSIPSVILSAYSSDEYLERAQEAGVFGYLLKPVATEALKTTLPVAWERAHTLLGGQRRVAQLEASVASRRVVEQAKWRVVSELGITEPEAHSALQRTARTRRMRLAEIAQSVLDSPADAWELQTGQAGS